MGGHSIPPDVIVRRCARSTEARCQRGKVQFFRRASIAKRIAPYGIVEKVIERRYLRSIQNFKNLYLPLADRWRIYDNSNIQENYLIAHGGHDVPTEIYEEEKWKTILAM